MSQQKSISMGAHSLGKPICHGFERPCTFLLRTPDHSTWAMSWAVFAETLKDKVMSACKQRPGLLLFSIKVVYFPSLLFFGLMQPTAWMVSAWAPLFHLLGKQGTPT